MNNSLEMWGEKSISAGYMQTEVGIIPKDWVVEPLENFTAFISYGFTNPMPTTTSGPFMITARDIANGRIQYNSARTTDLNAFNELLTSKSKPQKNDLLLTKDGTLGRLALAEDELICINQSVAILRPNKRIIPKFLQLLLESPFYQVRMLEDAGGSTIKHIYITIVNRMLIGLPTDLKEQKSIATALSDTDDLITALEQLIAKKLAIKTATMQQLLTGRTRLPQFAKQPSGAIKNYKSSELGIIPDDWETVAMGEMGVTYGGLSGKSKNDFGSGNSLYVPFTNIMANVIVNVNHLERVNVQETQRQVLPGDLLFNGSSETPEEVCFCSLMSEEIDKLYLNSFCFGFRASSQPKYLPLYIAYWFRSSAGRTAVSIMAQGSTRYNISKSQFLTLKIVLPPILEQTAIATVLSDMDAELEKLEQKLAKIRDIKQGMMQQLLTGRIRLPLDHQP